MDPSSLVFVVIVGMWAAYLLSHWVRRRDHLATARSVDRFSEAMRVLQRRTPVPAVALDRERPRAYVVAPARVNPQVVMAKQTAAVARPDAGARRPAGPSLRTSTGTATGRPGGTSAVAARTPTAGSRSVTARVVTARTAQRAAAARAQGPRRPSDRTAGAEARAGALVLLALLALTPVAWVLVAVAVVPWWVGAVVTAGLLADVAHLRQRAGHRRELARRRARLAQRQQTQARRASTTAVLAAAQTHRTSAAGAAAGAVATVDLAAAEQAAATSPGRSEPEVDADGWQPVPVPPPTYTLKPKAPTSRPLVRRAPAAEAASTAPEVPAEPAPAFDLDEVLERRIASNQ